MSWKFRFHLLKREQVFSLPLPASEANLASGIGISFSGDEVAYRVVRC
jgi:hypothetical protein